MSVRVMSWVWDNATASGGELLVLLAVADFADDDGTNAYPSVATLAAKCRISPRTVQRIIARLEDTGAITVGRSDGGREANRYTVVMQPVEPPLKTAPEPPVEAPHPRQSDTGVNLTPLSPGDTPPLSQLCHGSPVTAVTPEPPWNHHGTNHPPNPPADAGGRGGGCDRHRRPRDSCRACTRRPPRIALADLPEPVAALRGRLAGHAALAALRWDLTPTQLAAINALIDQHGAGRLAAEALRRTPPGAPPRHVGWFLPTWQALDPPRLIPAQRAAEPCPIHVGELAHCCRPCAADRKARPDLRAVQ